MRIEGVYYEVDWAAFQKGTSITVPCLDPDKAREEVKRVIDRIGFRTHTQVVIEDGVRALRVWRI